MKNGKSKEDLGTLQGGTNRYQEDSFMNPDYYDLTDSNGQGRMHDLKTLAKYMQQNPGKSNAVVAGGKDYQSSSPASD